ncbi:MAG: alpha/beta hydrolase [Myxococcales bacterium]|nr:alpha/beta hydrolase [Myxococcales bacterium]
MLVLLPGIQAGLAEFERLRPLLGEHLALALPDATADTLPAIAALVDAALPPGAHDLVGVSFGGLVAWALPAGRLRSLTTIGTLPYRTPAATRSGRVGCALPALPAALYRRWVRRRLRASLEADGADAELRLRVYEPDQAVLAARLRAIGGWELPPSPPVPAAWLWGATDPFVTWDHASVRQAGHEPHELPGGHRPHLSHPSEVARWLRGRATGPTGR